MFSAPEIPALPALVRVCFAAARCGARVIITETDSASFIDFASSACIAASACVGAAELRQVRRAAAVDGVIESVAEIDSLLTTALDFQECVILCRGASPEVQRTVTANVSRNKMQLALLVFELERDTVNALGDACSLMRISLHDALTGVSWCRSGFEQLTQDVCVENRMIRIRGERDSARESSALRVTRGAGDELHSTARLASLGSVVRVNVRASETSALMASSLASSLAVLDDAARRGVVLLADGSAHSVGAYCAARDFLVKT